MSNERRKLKRTKQYFCGLKFVTLLLLFVSLKGSLFAMQQQSNSKLPRCPMSPNCVCTEYPKDQAHYASPISFPDSESNTVIMDLIRSVIETMGGELQSSSSDYIHATFTSKIFRFVDDFECRIDTISNLLHCRSASRTGYSDFGVNKKRLREFKQTFLNKLESF